MSFFVSESLKEKINEDVLDDQILNNTDVMPPICLKIESSFYEVKKITSNVVTLLVSSEAKNSIDKIFSLGMDDLECQIYVYQKLLSSFTSDQLKIIEISSVNTRELEIIININKGVSL